MHQINPKKLLNSKWTAVHPLGKEKHFLVTEVMADEAGVVHSCLLEAIVTRRAEVLAWAALKDSSSWRQGWQ